MFKRWQATVPLTTTFGPWWLHGLAGVAVVSVVVRAFLLHLPEAFPGAASAGDIWYDLCIGYVAAWFFHMLVVVIPGARQRARVMGAAQPDLRRVAMTAAFIYEDLGRKKVQRVSDDPTLHEVTQLCASINMHSRAPAFVFHGTLTSDTLDWIEYMADELDQAARARDRLVPAFPYLDAEIVALMQPLANTRFERDVRMALKVGLNAPTLEPMAATLHEYVTMSREFELYLGPEVTGLVSSRRK